MWACLPFTIVRPAHGGEVGPRAPREDGIARFCRTAGPGTDRRRTAGFRRARGLRMLPGSRCRSGSGRFAMRAFSVTFHLVTMLSCLLAGLVIFGRQRGFEIPLAWAAVLAAVWLAILVRVVRLVAGALAGARGRGAEQPRRGASTGASAA